MFLHHKPEKMRESDFHNPPAKFRGAPFWAWNCKLEKEELREQIGCFKEMGMGGFHMHCRTGLDTEYLGDEFMELVADCSETAKSKDMLCWLYDEDRYASGFGGGYVTKDIAFRERYLYFTPEKEEGFLKNRASFEAACAKGEEPKGYFLKAYRITLENGLLDTYEVFEDEETEGIGLWYLYLALDEKSSWYNNQTYVDTLNKAALDKFIDITYERYYEKLGKDFGAGIPAIFTDEPQFSEIQHLAFAEERRGLKLPYTDDMEESFQKTYGESLLGHLPEVIWEKLDGEAATLRYRYINHLTDRFVEAYAKNIGDWCEAHNLAFTGHMKGEETLASQTVFVGEVMRSLRHFHIPGHDVLCDQRDYPTAKMAQSVARQYGRYGGLTETYGVTNWDFDFKGHKMSGDWQAAMGIAVRVHHVSWVSMKGEAKRDYPASINYQSPWYKEYPLLEDYFGRVNAAMTSGTPDVKIGVIHPIESYWMAFGPYEQTYEKREAMEEQYRNLCDWLTFGQLDFDYISEALLEEEKGAAYDENGFIMGEMRYPVVLVPDCTTLRKNTLKRLADYAGNGGQVVILGHPPVCVDGMKSGQGEELAALCERIPFEKGTVMKRLESFRSVDVLLENGGRSDNLLYQMRRDEDGKWFFLAHGFEKIRDGFWSMVDCEDYPYVEKLHIRLEGLYDLTVYDAMSGENYPLPCSHRDGQTWCEYNLGVHDSLLLRLRPAESGAGGREDKKTDKKQDTDPENRMLAEPQYRTRLPQPQSVTLEEPNVLLLDKADYRLNDGMWKKEEDILKLDNICRESLGYPPKEEAGAQPWTVKDQKGFPDTLWLRFNIESEIDVPACLALESRDVTQIYVNGILVDKEAKGWFVDKAIEKVEIPDIHKGSNTIVLQIPYGEKANVESCYLLGGFGVEVCGKEKRIVPLRNEYVFGDLTRQGLPFYGGNLTYHCKFVSEGGRTHIRAQYFSSPLLGVTLNGKKMGRIAFAPYELDLGVLEPGDYEIDITAFGNRFPTFGQLHNCDKNYSWFASCSWRTKNDRYAPEYQMKETGVLVTPELIVREDRIWNSIM
ncbi:glycosyl hydrolase [Faecalicatena orotica]|uniref:Alpha-L-rhamnosidase-like protein n=1 Tax=Faecalicatena orotica TaxID=1544 RepID=A0A2Y9BJ11_9FIRM|nr:glycosyl hydrolase [Faecalicatena orotica]PWJ23689.1 alpha-L-rhamnosidase-like protein [Faecalicatena orotica]SSA57601.1 alpha-L-rhamnosidase [Faecalicatena orotica]